MKRQQSENDGFGYLGNALIKRDGVEQNFTRVEIEEYRKCMDSPEYFASTYCKIINMDKGLIPFDLYPYQQKMFQNFIKNRFNIVLACRQSGKSISVSIFLLWYALFHSEKTIAILANKGATAREMLARITLALENIPFFLQPGCKTVNKGSIRFSNNSRIVAMATSANGARSNSVDVLYLDEFAFVENADKFYTSTYPVITAGQNTKVIITSTMNGVGNLFYRMWEGALQKKNSFVPFRVDWMDVPGRDEAWKKMTIANTSENQFAQEYSNRAIGTTLTLVDPDTLLALKASAPINSKKAMLGGGVIKIFAEPVEGHRYIGTVDVCKGRGQDYSTLTIIDISTSPFEQVVSYKDNTISPMLLGDIIVPMAKRYNNCLLIIESNDSGVVVCNSVYYDHEYENTFVESSVKAGGVGVTMTKRIKRIGCSNLKDLLEARKLKIHDEDTIAELTTFEADGDSFAASESNHDDLVMNLVMFSWFVSTPMAELKDSELKNIMFAEKIKAAEEAEPDKFYINDYRDYPSSSDIYRDMADKLREFQTL